MKKFSVIALSAAILLSLVSCKSADKRNFEALKTAVAAAGYDVSDTYVDSSFEGVVSAFSVKINFDENTEASVPIILCSSEKAVKKNEEKFGEDSIKLVISNGKIFSYPGKDYPEHVLNVVRAIVNGESIPKK